MLVGGLHHRRTRLWGWWKSKESGSENLAVSWNDRDFEHFHVPPSGNDCYIGNRNMTQSKLWVFPWKMVILHSHVSFSHKKQCDVQDSSKKKACMYLPTFFLSSKGPPAMSLPRLCQCFSNCWSSTFWLRCASDCQCGVHWKQYGKLGTWFIKPHVNWFFMRKLLNTFGMIGHFHMR